MRISEMQLTQYDWLIRFMDAAQGQLSKFADLMICNSYAGLRHVQASGSRARRAIAIPNGIDTDRYRPNPTARREIRREWGIAPGERVVGLVGRLDPMKGHPTFLSAAAKITAECTRVRFVCISQGPEDYGHQLKELANGLGISERITWSSGRDDMPAVYPAFDVLVSASMTGKGSPTSSARQWHVVCHAWLPMSATLRLSSETKAKLCRPKTQTHCPRPFFARSLELMVTSSILTRFALESLRPSQCHPWWTGPRQRSSS